MLRWLTTQRKSPRSTGYWLPPFPSPSLVSSCSSLRLFALLWTLFVSMPAKSNNLLVSILEGSTWGEVRSRGTAKKSSIAGFAVALICSEPILFYTLAAYSVVLLSFSFKPEISAKLSTLVNGWFDEGACCEFMDFYWIRFWWTWAPAGPEKRERDSPSIWSFWLFETCWEADYGCPFPPGKTPGL